MCVWLTEQNGSTEGTIGTVWFVNHSDIQSVSIEETCESVSRMLLTWMAGYTISYM